MLSWRMEHLVFYEGSGLAGAGIVRFRFFEQSGLFVCGEKPKYYIAKSKIERKVEVLLPRFAAGLEASPAEAILINVIMPP